MLEGKLFINLKVYKGLHNIEFLHFRDFTKCLLDSFYKRLKNKNEV